MQEDPSHVVAMASMWMVMNMRMIMEIWDPIRLVVCMKVIVISEKITGCHRRSPVLRMRTRLVE
jgi:hypothetical protein